MKYLKLNGALLLIMLSLSFSSWSISLVKESVGRYNSCELIDNNDGTSTAIANVTYFYYIHEHPMLSRAVILHFYNKDGSFAPNKQVNASEILFNGVSSSGKDVFGTTSIFVGNKGFWKGMVSRTGDFSIRVPNSYLADWKGMALRIVDRSIQGVYYIEEKGAAYITYAGDGTCRIIEPEVPPDPEPNIKFEFELPRVWDLKEIPPGISEVNFSGVRSEEFCIKYDNKQTSDTQFLMMVNSANEKENNFNLINNIIPENSIKYKLLLSDGVSNLMFPSNSGNGYLFNKNAQDVCFYPTFKIDAGDNPQKGQYSDILNFNIIVKP